MTPKYKLNQNVFLMQGNAPQMRKIIAVAEIDQGNYYILNRLGESIENAKMSEYNLSISDEKLNWIREENIFETIKLLQESLFGDVS